jgi:hypothetical protein
MRYLPFTLLLYTALVIGQLVAPVAPPQELPGERAPDSYSVYAAALRNAIWNHPDETNTYFISDRTGQTYNVGVECVHAPEGDTSALSQAVADFRAQQGKVYQLRDEFNFKERKLRLLTPREENPLQKRLSGLSPAAPISATSLKEATDVIRLSNIGFSRDRSLAIVAVSNYCGSLCGGEKWHIFKRDGNGWVEREFDGCTAISGVPVKPQRDEVAVGGRTRTKVELLLIPRTIVSDDNQEESFTIRLVNTGSTSVAFPVPTKFCGDSRDGYVVVYHTMLPPIPKDYRQIGLGCVVERFRRADVLADAKKWKTLAPGDVYDIVVSPTDLYLDADYAYELQAKYFAPFLSTNELSALSGHGINVPRQDVESERIIVKPTNRRPQHSH